MIVGTLNIRCIAPEDGKNHWVFRSKYVKQYIVDSGYDIIALQEVTLPQLIDLKLLFLGTDYKFIYYHNSLIEGYNYIVILYKASRFTCMKHDRIWLSETPRKYGSKFPGMYNPRIAVAGVFYDKTTCNTFVFCGTHLDHAKDGKREACAEILCKFVNTFHSNLYPDFSLPVIVGGDLNGTPDQMFMKVFASYGFTDCDKTNTPTFHGFSGKPMSKIDYLLVAGENTKWNIAACGVSGDRLNEKPMLSDHCPVWCILNLTA